MTEDQKANLIRLIDESWNKGNLDALDKFVAPDYIRHGAPFPDIVGLEALKEYISAIRETFSGFRLTMMDMIFEGDLMATRWPWTGKHTSQTTRIPFPPSGNQLLVTGCSMIHTFGGKNKEEWAYPDDLGMLQQIGIKIPMG